jgi:hypothetical protein
MATFAPLRGNVINSYGRPITGTTVTVYLTGTLTLASLFSDRAGSLGISNPVTVEATDASYLFYVDTANRYDLVMAKTGVTFDNTDNVDIDALSSVSTSVVANNNHWTGNNTFEFGPNYIADTGSTPGVYLAVLSPAITAYTAGLIVNFTASTTNTGASTLNVNSLGAKSIKKHGITTLDPNDIVSGAAVTVIYDGTNFQLVNKAQGTVVYGADTNTTAGVYTVALSPALSAYTTGLVVFFKANTTNSGSATLNVNGLGAKTIKKNATSDLSGSDIIVSQEVAVVYDGTNFQLLSPINASGTASRPLNPLTTSYEKEDFLSNVDSAGDSKFGDLSWNTNNIGSISFIPSETSHPGILRITCTSGNYRVVYIYNSAGSPTLLPAQTFDTYMVLRTNQNDSNTTFRMGFGDLPAADPPSNGIYLERTGADASWFLVTRSGGVESRQTTAVAIGTVFVSARLRRVDASTIGLTIGTNAEATTTANIPSTGLEPMIGLKSASSTKTADIDFFDELITGLSRQ